MKLRWIEWGLALLLGALMALMLLSPGSPRPDDLELEVVSVEELPPEEPGAPQQVSVKVRWRWRQQPANTAGSASVAIGADPMRWSLKEDYWHGADWNRAAVLNQPQTFGGVEALPGQDGEQIFTLEGYKLGRFYRASAITLHVQYFYQGPEVTLWPRRTWVKTVSDTFSLTAEPMEFAGET